MRTYSKLTDEQIDKMLSIYNNSFDLIKTDKNMFVKRLKINAGSKVSIEDDVDYGFVVFDKSAILLICVAPSSRNKGLGSKLLYKAESEIAKTSDKIKVGSGSTYLIAGIPQDPQSDASEWFARRGYKTDWVCFDMIVDLGKFAPVIQLDSLPKNISIKIRDNTNCSEVEESSITAEDISQGWGEVYNNEDKMVMLALDKNKVVGVNMIEKGCLFPKSLANAGIFGCLGVKAEYRKHGIGMKLYQEALIQLKKMGCKFCHIGYTYLDWWYGKLGAKKYINYTICSKSTEGSKWKS